jgi:protein-S-isoprenylcysteine O-methyltransferase Ste14
MIGEVISIYGSTVFFLFFGSSILFFILLKASRRRGSKTLKRYFKVYSVIVLGVLVLFGAELIFGGVTQVLSGEPGGSPWIPWIMIGGGSAILTVAGLVFYLIFIAGPRALRKLMKRKKEHPNARWMWVDKCLERRIVCSPTGNLCSPGLLSRW